MWARCLAFQGGRGRRFRFLNGNSGNTIKGAQFTGLDNYELCVRLLNQEPFFARVASRRLIRRDGGEELSCVVRDNGMANDTESRRK